MLTSDIFLSICLKIGVKLCKDFFLSVRGHYLAGLISSTLTKSSMLHLTSRPISIGRFRVNPNEITKINNTSKSNLYEVI